jgi:hypothetical protein
MIILTFNSGGAVLTQLLAAQDEGKIKISTFVRSTEYRDVIRALGVTPIHFGGLHGLETIREASKHDGA